MNRNDISKPRSRGFQALNLGDNNLSAENQDKKLTDIIPYILFCRSTYNDNTSEEFEPIYDKSSNLLELSTPEDILDIIVNSNVGPKTKKYLRWLVQIGRVETGKETTTLTKVKETTTSAIEVGETHIIPEGQCYTPGLDRLDVFLNGQLLFEGADSDYIEVDDNSIQFLFTVPPDSNLTYFVRT